MLNTQTDQSPIVDRRRPTPLVPMMPPQLLVPAASTSGPSQADMIYAARVLHAGAARAPQPPPMIPHPMHIADVDPRHMRKARRG